MSREWESRSDGLDKFLLRVFLCNLSQQNVEIIVMVTNLVEGGRAKCDQYWPARVGTPSSLPILFSLRQERILHYPLTARVSTSF